MNKHNNKKNQGRGNTTLFYDCLPLFFITTFLVVFLFFSSASAWADDSANFQTFIEQLKQQAKANGIHPDLIEKYFENIREYPHLKVLPAILTLPPHTKLVIHYPDYDKLIADRVSDKMIDDFLQNYKTNLLIISDRYQVQPEYIMVLLGLETEFGKHIGDDPIIETLVNTAYLSKNRNGYFAGLVIDALKIIQNTNPPIPEQTRSTFDGGMGIPQFEPNIYLSYAQSFDGKSTPNIWTNMNDAMASAANFLHQLGWHYNEPWGYKASLDTEHLQLDDYAEKKIELTLDDWKKLGVKIERADKPYNKDWPARLLLPYGIKGPPFLVLHNFQVLRGWNGSVNETLETGLLADKYTHRIK